MVQRSSLWAKFAVNYILYPVLRKQDGLDDAFADVEVGGTQFGESDCGACRSSDTSFDRPWKCVNIRYNLVAY